MDFGDLLEMHDAALARWEEKPPERVPPGEDLTSLILAQHCCNFTLWSLEDEARRRDVADSVIARIKRSIDRWNQNRNDLIERVDAAILASLPEKSGNGAEQHSETPGQMIDRLSILALKIRNMSRLASRRNDRELAAECAAKLAVLREQREDLFRCLRDLLRACTEGRRYFKLYRQFKTYNDPRLNPALARSRS